jgi:hypothetical protein
MNAKSNTPEYIILKLRKEFISKHENDANVIFFSARTWAEGSDVLLIK